MSHENKVKFVCADCSVYYWINDRNNFICPNCEDKNNICDECGLIHSEDNNKLSIKEDVKR